MTYQEKLEYLRGYLAAKKDLAVIQRQYNDLATMATHITPGLDGMPHGSGVNDKVGNLATEMAELKSRLTVTASRQPGKWPKLKRQSASCTAANAR